MDNMYGAFLAAKLTSASDGSESFGNKKVKVIAGVLRNSGTGWQLLNNENHSPLNLNSASVNNDGNIVLSYGFTAKKVLSLIVTPDDTFAQKYTCGASVGLSSATISIYTIPRAMGGFVYYKDNAWDYQYSDFTGASFNSTTGLLSLSHESLESLALRESQNVSVTGRDCNARLSSSGRDSMGIKFFDWSGNVITTPSDEKVFAFKNINSVHVAANELISSTGNFWIYGIMEID